MTRRPLDDGGSAVVEFVVVVPLLVLVVLGVAQVALALHVRATVVSAATEGARAAALAGGDPAVARSRIERALASSFAEGVVRSVAVRRTRFGALPVVDVEVRATLPLAGLLGPAALVVHGHALTED